MRKPMLCIVICLVMALCGCVHSVSSGENLLSPTEVPTTVQTTATVPVVTPTGDAATTASSQTTTSASSPDVPDPSPIPNLPDEGYTKRY